MNIKARVKKLEKESSAQFEVLVPLVMCPEAESALTEASVRARYVAGTVTEEFVREDGEDLKAFKDRVKRDGGRIMRAAHPNAILVYAGVLGDKYSECC